MRLPPGHYSAVSLLLSNGADVGFRDRDGNSVLHRAAINGSVVCLVPHLICFLKLYSIILHFKFIFNNNNNILLKKLIFFRPTSFGRDPREALQKGALGLLKVGPPEREAPSVKIGTIQRRLAWPLRKDDTQNREDTQLFCLPIP